MEWYVIQAYSGYEKKVKIALEEKIKLNNLSDKFGEILIPTEQIVELKGGNKKTTERKFFPGYILVQMILEDIHGSLCNLLQEFQVLLEAQKINLSLFQMKMLIILLTELK